MLLDRDRSLLMVIDIQERLAPAIAGAEAVIARTRLLLEAAARLGVPVLATEQYPKGLGPSDRRLDPLLEGATVLAKTSFSALGEPKVCDWLERSGRDQILLAGMETHICVLQTALALRAAGHMTAVIADAVGSRRPERKALGLERMAANGVELVESEMVLFEWLGEAGTPQFKELSRLVREP